MNEKLYANRSKEASDMPEELMVRGVGSVQARKRHIEMITLIFLMERLDRIQADVRSSFYEA